LHISRSRKEVRRSFLKDTEANDQRFRAVIVRAIIEKDPELKSDPNHISLLCEVEGDPLDDIYMYNKILDCIEGENLAVDNDTEQLYQFGLISSHQGPLQISARD
jgi:hypothetical protein